MRLQPHVLLPLVAAFSLNVWFNWKELFLFCIVVAAHAATASDSTTPYGPPTRPDATTSPSSETTAPPPPFSSSPSLVPLVTGKVDSLLDAAVQSELVGRRYVDTSELGLPPSSLSHRMATEAASARLRPDPHLVEAVA